MILKSIIPILAILLFSVSLCDAQNEDLYSLVKTGEKVPEFIVKTIDGKTVDIDKLKGKVVLVNFFATWCRPCMEEMPNLEKLQHRFSDSDFVILSIGREHKLAELQLFNQSKEFTFNIAADPDRKIYELFAEKMIPRNYVVDKGGTICYQCSGYSHSQFSSMIAFIESKIAGK